MYMKPTVTFCSKGSPVLPSKSRTLPEALRPSGRFSSTLSLIGESGFCFVHSIRASSTCCGVAPSNTGVATGVGVRVQDHVDRAAVLEERHVLLGDDPGDHALVAVTAGELVALGDLALLRDVDADELVHARRQVVAVLARERLDVDHLAALAVRDLE